MLPIFDRQFLQDLRDVAYGMTTANLNPDWVRAYQAMADAADRLDAMTARSQITVIHPDLEQPIQCPHFKAKVEH